MRSTTNPAPISRCRKRQDSNFITFSVAGWQHRTARRQESHQIAMSGDNKLTFDPPTHLPEFTLNLIRSFRADKETNREINRQKIGRKQYPVPLSGTGLKGHHMNNTKSAVGAPKKSNCDLSECEWKIVNFIGSRWHILLGTETVCPFIRCRAGLSV